MGQDLTAQRPALRLFRRVGGQHVGQPVLLPLGLLQVIFQPFRNGLGGEAGVIGERPGSASMSWP